VYFEDTDRRIVLNGITHCCLFAFKNSFKNKFRSLDEASVLILYCVFELYKRLDRTFGRA
jgi:hypothetical protein